jgi:chemotaxis protein MotB
MPKARPIIVIKKKAHRDDSHGGAWKVAYADFVTALMSLFIVLWLMNTSPSVRKAVAGYFNDPMGRASNEGTDREGVNDNLPLKKDDIRKLKEQLEKVIYQQPDLRKLSKQIEIKITPEGLRIELLENDKGTFFESGSAELSKPGQEILTLLAGQLKEIPNHVSMEGHTDARPYSGKTNYTNWELSTDRANTARRLMQDNGLRRDQITQVRGYADQKLRIPSNPLDPSNRRISLIVHYLEVPPTPSTNTITVDQVSSDSKTIEQLANEEKSQAAKNPVAGTVENSSTQPTSNKPSAGTQAAPSAKKSLFSAFAFGKK